MAFKGVGFTAYGCQPEAKPVNRGHIILTGTGLSYTKRIVGASKQNLERVYRLLALRAGCLSFTSKQDVGFQTKTAVGNTAFKTIISIVKQFLFLSPA